MTESYSPKPLKVYHGKAIIAVPFTVAKNAKPGRRTLAGEVYVCVPEARRGSKEHGTRVADELLLYALHGMLHLCGFDDRTPAGFQRMHRTEDRILTRIGVGAVFEPHRHTRRASASGAR